MIVDLVIATNMHHGSYGSMGLYKGRFVWGYSFPGFQGLSVGLRTGYHLEGHADV